MIKEEKEGHGSFHRNKSSSMRFPVNGFEVGILEVGLIVG